jgi:hypothetical protein
LEFWDEIAEVPEGCVLFAVESADWELIFTDPVGGVKASVVLLPCDEIAADDPEGGVLDALESDIWLDITGRFPEGCEFIAVESAFCGAIETEPHGLVVVT